MIEEKEGQRVISYFRDYIGIEQQEEWETIMGSINEAFLKPTIKRQKLQPRNALDKLVLHVLNRNINGNFYIGCRYMLEQWKKEEIKR